MKINACVMEVFAEDVPLAHVILNGKLDADEVKSLIHNEGVNLRLYIYTTGMQGTIPVAPHTAQPLVDALVALRRRNPASVLSVSLTLRPVGAPVAGTIKPETLYHTCFESAKETGIPAFQYEACEATISARQVAWMLKDE